MGKACTYTQLFFWTKVDKSKKSVCSLLLNCLRQNIFSELFFLLQISYHMTETVFDTNISQYSSAKQKQHHPTTVIIFQYSQHQQAKVSIQNTITIAALLKSLVFLAQTICHPPLSVGDEFQASGRSTPCEIYFQITVRLISSSWGDIFQAPREIDFKLTGRLISSSQENCVHAYGDIDIQAPGQINVHDHTDQWILFISLCLKILH